ncbi:SMOX oxidase, partial [Atractosteus spatula]|nr:SMOX oxidase [Atractosteus spatula]
MSTNPIPNTPKVVIVGAGLAGLTAATTLVKAGFQNVWILEAMDRPGGRIHTTRPFGTEIIEMGANWIHGQEQNPVFLLAQEHGLLAEETSSSVMCLPDSITPRDFFFHEHRRQLPSETVEKVCSFFTKLTSKAFNQELDNKYALKTLGDFLDEEFQDSPLVSLKDGPKIFEWCKRSECTDEASSSLYDVSAKDIGLYTALEGGFFNCLGPGGYQAVLDVLLNSLPPGILICNKPVKRIRWGLVEAAHPVKIVCEDGLELQADHVIVTASLGVLQEQASVMFEPLLPEQKMRAIERLGFGVVDKIYLKFSERFWPPDCAGIQLVWEEGPEDKNVYTTLLDGESWKKTWYKKICGFDIVARHPTVLCGWITGREAQYMETLDEKAVRDVCVGLLRSFTGWNIPDPVCVLRSNWWENPYVRGSYTYIPSGVDAVKEQEDLSEPVPSAACNPQLKPLQVLFAGEATHVNFYTTTHGANLSGVREAQRIINHYSHEKTSL